MLFNFKNDLIIFKNVHIENGSILLNMSINYIQFCLLHLNIFHVVKNIIIIFLTATWYFII